MNACVVPIKAFASAKTRLGPRLDELQREVLARVSAHRVLRTIEQSPLFDLRIAVVEDEETATFARLHFFEPLLHPELWGQSAAVEAGFEWARAHGATTLVTVSADVPLVRADDLGALVAEGSPRLVLARDREGRGTNALRLTPARYLRLHFGPDSLEKHKREAKDAGLPVHVIDSPRLRLDLDSPNDLDILERVGPEGRQVLTEAGQLRLDLEKQRAEAAADRG